MSGSTNAIVDEEFLKSAFHKFIEYGGTYAATDEEFIKSNFYTLLRVVEDALEQKTMSIQTKIALTDHFLNRYFQQDAVASQMMEIACDLSSKRDTVETVSPLW